MLQYTLPSSEELIDSDDLPVDNEDQNFIPNVLLFLLEYIWAERDDWFFAVDMGIYHTTGANPRVPVVPDGFLSLSVERRKDNKSRRSYVLWEEQNIPPILTLEVVSHTSGNEYDEKLKIYARLGVKYYVIYNPQFWRRDGHLPLEIYKLSAGEYQLQMGEPLWMHEIGLGIGRFRLTERYGREGLSWFDAKGDRFLTSVEVAGMEKQEKMRAEQEKQHLITYLRSLGIDPDNLPNSPKLS
jgi:Uma2 family endonuclease